MASTVTAAGATDNHPVLIIGGDTVPPAGEPCVGIGVRLWELYRGLQAAGVPVVLSLPERQCRKIPPEYAVQPHIFARIAELLNRVSPSVIIVEQRYVPPDLEQANIPLVLDLPGPHVLEYLMIEPASVTERLSAKLRMFSLADFYTVALPQQIPYYLGWYMLAGGLDREPPFAVVPIAFSPDLPERGVPETAELKVIYAGYRYPWQAGGGVADLLAGLGGRDDCRIELIIGDHPTAKLGGEAEPALPPLPANVVLRDPLDFSALTGSFGEADVAVNIDPPTAERRICSSIRVIHQLWSGVPVVVNAELPVAAEVARAGLGFTYAEGELQACLASLPARREEIKACRARVRAWAERRAVWTTAIAPLAEFCRKPRWRTQRGPANPFPGMIEQLRAELAEQQHNAYALQETQKALAEAHNGYQRHIAELHAGQQRHIEGYRRRIAELQEEEQRLREMLARANEDQQRLTIDLQAVTADLRRIQNHWLLRFRRWVKKLIVRLPSG